jgi:hypothetical protein
VHVQQTQPDRDPPNTPTDRDKPRLLSHSDPPADPITSNRVPNLVAIIVVLLVTAFVILHVAGVFGPGSH